MIRRLRRRPARVAGSTGTDPVLLQVADRHLPHDGAAVAVVATGGHPVVDALRRLRPGLEPLVVDPLGDGSERHVALTLSAPYDLVVDLGPSRGRARRFVDTVFHLRDGGALVVAGAAPTDPADAADPLADLVRRVESARARGRPRRGADTRVRDAHALARATASLVTEGEHLVAVGRDIGARAKLHEPEMTAYVEATGVTRHRVLDVVPGGPFRSRCEVRESGPDWRGEHAEVMHPPDISLREYRDVVVGPRQVVSDERVIMSDSYRHNQRGRLVNKGTDDLAPLFARMVGPGGPPPEVLEGTWFHLDNEVRGHFGHLLTETLSRMWAWPQVKERHPDVKVILGRTRKRPEIQPWEEVLLSAGGIEPEDVLLIDRPVRVPHLLSATPMLSNPHYVHPRITETWDRVGDALAADAGTRDRPARIFCTRRADEVRPCHNVHEVEDLFAAHGFVVVHPADLPLAEQVAMFRAAGVVAGFAGSGLFQLCFAREPKRVITLGPTRYSARNEYLIASARGHTIDAIRSLPEEDHFHAGFTFDHAREGRHLEAVLAAL